MDLRKLNEVDINDLRNMDLADIADWPLAGRLVLVVVVIAAVATGGYFFMVQDQIERLERLEADEEDLRSRFEQRQQQAANLEDYREQLEEMRVEFGTLLQQLPSEREVPSVLLDISQTAAANGLEERLFEPEGEQEQDFYAEIPYRIRLVGRYHEFAQFVDDVSKLPRIVTAHDVEIAPTGDEDKLELEMVVKTYRYLDDEDDEEFAQ